MNEIEKERIWNEMVDNNKKKIGVVRKEFGEESKKKGGWRKELVSDLKLLVILMVVWIGFLSIIEITGL